MANRDTQGTKLALIQKDVSFINEKIDDQNKKFDGVNDRLVSIDNKLSSHYVSKDEFEPIKKVVYGLVGLILVAVVGAIVSLVITQ